MTRGDEESGLVGTRRRRRRRRDLAPSCWSVF
jgi:hypothetical protein